jgi:CBS domain-containing protein
MPSTRTPRSTATVGDVMSEAIIDCSPDMPAVELAATMVSRRIHCVVVDGIARRPDGGEQLVWGIVSDLDLLAAAGRDGLAASDLAATAAVTVGTGEAIEAAAQLMIEHETSHLVVVAPGGGRPVGIVSSLDVAGALS